MPEKQRSPHPVPKAKQKLSFSRTASFKMKKTVKSLSRAFSLKKKSWNPDSYSPITKYGSKGLYQDQSVLEQRHKYEEDQLGTLLSEEWQQEIQLLHQTLEEQTTEDIMGKEAYNKSVSMVTAYPPSIQPPHTRKSELYINNGAFEELDQHAIKLSNRNFTNYTDLVRDLTRDCQKELEKARVLFRWVVAVSQSSSAAPLLKDVKNGRESDHQLYRKLCSYAGLPCKIILGYSKGAGYRPGMEIETDAFRNSWTAVAIAGSWRFVNCTWAARHVNGSTDDVHHRLDEFYFLTDPENHIYQHYPDDPAWQLLENPLGLGDFVNLPVVKSSFFNNNLHFVSCQSSILTTDNGVTEIRLDSPLISAFGSVLVPCGESESKQQPIENAVLQRIVDGEIMFTVNLPEPGQYHFSVYVGDYWNPECLESTFSLRIDYRSVAVSSQLVRAPFPPVSYYGPTPIMEIIGVSPDTHADPLIVSNDGNLAIKLNVDEDTKLTQTLEYFDSQDGSLTDVNRYVFVRSRDDFSISYDINCPEKGYYVFSVFGTDGSGDSTTLDCIYRYLIVCQSNNPSAKAFPRTFSRWQHCTLHSPLSGDLLPHRLQPFKLEVPNAEDVFVSSGDVFFHLKQTDDCTWTGDIQTGATTCVLQVIARFPNGRECSIFSRLLEFNIAGTKVSEV